MKTLLCELSRWLAAGLAICLLVVGSMQVQNSTASPDAVLSAVTAELDMTKMQEAPAQTIKRLYGVNPSDYESCTLYYPVTNMDVDELLLVKLTDISQGEPLKMAVNERLSRQKHTFENYGPSQMALLNEHAVLELRGSYLLFVVSANADDAKAAFIKALQADPTTEQKGA